MLYRFKGFKSMAFLHRPDVVHFNGYRVEYLGFCLEENQDKTPIVFIGGAFQNFFSFKKEVQLLIEHAPIILLDLPSQGTNQQLCPELKFEDFANLLKSFCDHFNLQKITPIALSYGSATGFLFADIYPDTVEKLILGGTTSKLRESMAKLLKESIRVLHRGDKDDFAEGAVLNLINFGHRHETQISPRIIKGFFKNMKGLKENCIHRYIDNTSRLLELQDIVGSPKCPTLILTGEFDSFTTPFENYSVAKKIPHSKFILIKDADHLANLEKRDVTINTYKNFLFGNGVEEVEGIEIIDESNIKSLDRRLNQRKALNETYVKLVDVDQKHTEAQVLDINYFGCKLKFNDEPPKEMNFDSPLEFHFTDSHHKEISNLELRGFIFDDLNNPRCIFKRSNFAQGEKLEQFLETLH